jgi:hypothetical protein
VRAVNERSGREFTAYFKSKSGEPAIPGTAHWRLIACPETSAAVLQDWTPEVAEPVFDAESGGVTGIKVSINVDGMHHRVGTPRRPREERELQVVADMGTGREYSKTVRYYVEAMAGGRS